MLIKSIVAITQTLVYNILLFIHILFLTAAAMLTKEKSL